MQSQAQMSEALRLCAAKDTRVAQLETALAHMEDQLRTAQQQLREAQMQLQLQTASAHHCHHHDTTHLQLGPVRNEQAGKLN